jgi:hypothetical protein
MTSIEHVEILSKKYSMAPEEFIKFGSYLAMRERKRKLQIERFEVLSRYGTETVEALKDKIKNGTIPEHPSWEDLIEIKNIESEIREIENDIRTLQQA